MEFKLCLTGNRPAAGDLVLNAEVPLSGVRFVEEFGKAMRRSIDHVGRYRHTTLGALATYEVTVPQQMAIESGLFKDSDTVQIFVENNLLHKFIYYAASMSKGASGRACYPYMVNEATLITMVDELAFLDAWASTGYATSLKLIDGQIVDAMKYVVNSPTNNKNEYVGSGNNGGIGCDGCTCHPSNDDSNNRPVKPNRPHAIKPSTPPGYQQPEDDGDCICGGNFIKPGTIILDPM